MGVAMFQRARQRLQNLQRGKEQASAVIPEESAVIPEGSINNADEGRNDADEEWEQKLLGLPGLDENAGGKTSAFVCPTCGRDCRSNMAYSKHVKVCRG
jgi:hypothetical protein